MHSPFSFRIGVFGSLLYFFVLFCPYPPAHASTADIMLQEVMIAGTNPSDEFIELYNQSDTAFDLAGMQLRKRTATGSESSLRVFPKNSLIPARGTFLWAHHDSIFAPPFADTETNSASLAPDNSIGLFTRSGATGLLIDSLAWGKGALFIPETPLLPNPEKTTSLSRDLATRSWSNISLPTPTNSQSVSFVMPQKDPIPLPDPLPPAPIPTQAALIHIHEILSNPVGDESLGEFIELINDGTSAVDLSGFILHDGSKTGQYSFPSGTTIEAGGYLVLPRSTSKLSLNNTNETLSLFDPSNTLIDSVHYTKSKEGVSQNRVGDSLRGGVPTPGFANQLNILPETKEKVPKKGHRGLAITFNARGKDSEGSTLKYTWDFGDGHKSYKEKTTHRYDENGTYTIALTTTDGSDDVVETFPIDITSFPEANIRITALSPNPTGKDAEHEWLLIENRSKKSIDLLDFGIATGWKKLINHPIKKSLIIPPKSTITLTREYALFTLPNQKGKIELRAPDGKVLQDIRYKEEKSIAPDMVYRKEKGKRWTWHDAETIKAATPPKENVPVPEEMPVTKEENTLLPVTTDIPEPATPLDVPPLPLETEATTLELPLEEESEQAVLGATTATPSTPDPELPDTPLSFSQWLERTLMEINATINAWRNTYRDFP